MIKTAAKDMTKGSIRGNIFLFALPIFLSNLFQQLYNTADSIIVGNFSGETALAAVASSGTLIFMFVGFFNGTALGAGVVISKLFGAKRYSDMKRAIHTDVAFGLVSSVLLTVLGVFLAPYVLIVINTAPEVLPESTKYFQIYFLGIGFVIMYNIAVGILQAVGDSRHPLYYLIFSSVLNVALDILFVGVFKWGVVGAAVATVIAEFFSALFCFIRLMRTTEVYKVRIKEIKFHSDMIDEIVRYGLPSGVQNSIIAFANIIVQSKINGFGKYAMAGCGSYAKVEGFAFLPITCFSQALTTFIGQNLGAKEYGRAAEGAAFGITCSVIMAEIIGIIIFAFAPLFISAFNTNPSIVEIGVRQARVESLMFCLLAYAHCIAGICRGAGRASVPMYIMLAAWCVIRVIFVTVTLKIVNVIDVIFFAYPLTWCISCFIFLYYYLKSDWLHAFERDLTLKLKINIKRYKAYNFKTAI